MNSWIDFDELFHDASRCNGMIHRIVRFAHTLRFLRPRQLGYLIIRRLLPVRHRTVSHGAVRRRLLVGPTSAWISKKAAASTYEFCFLNIRKVMSRPNVDWASSDMSKLWRYNLHYFDYLQESGRTQDEKRRLISDWIAHNAPGATDAWEPYTVSLRLVNWIKFFMKEEDRLPEEWLDSIYTHAQWLEQNLEYHLLANHYLKNGVALFFAGMYFDGADADRWLTKGRQILADELDEQFLSDGGHFERSPMYHAISLVDYLDVLNLMIGSQRALHFDEQQRFTTRVHEALRFLDDICLPDGDIPLFNDAALGIAPPPGDILTYGGQIMKYKRLAFSDGLTTSEKPQTGYYVIRDASDMMVIDCGPVGPDYQPGHAHADTLSFELAVNGRRIIVDSGVYDYEPGWRRTYARSTRAHNTLCVDQQDQSETWGVFRVARRAYPIYGRITGDREGRVTFEGAHDGYARLSGRLTHSRMIEYVSPGEWTVRDTVNGEGIHTIESLLHVHPDYRLVLVGQSAKIRDEKGNAILVITPTPNVALRLEPGWYFPEFGLEYPKSTLVMTYQGTVPVTIIYRMTKTGSTLP